MPVHDRRQRRRILTVRNVRNAIVVLVLLFAVVSIVSEMRGRNATSYGRLYGRTLDKAPTVTAEAPVPVVEGAPVADQVGADPMLMAPAARSQWLIEEKAEPVAAEPVAQAPVTKVHLTDGDVAIVGGPDGVAVAAPKSRVRPVLSGGIFKNETPPVRQ
ncbi:MAG: hypothetical protein WA208_14895 [Thermoanaerobaculia bacterium]